jgi:3-oxoacyl-[acyl-carrier protein] reductase
LNLKNIEQLTLLTNSDYVYVNPIVKVQKIDLSDSNNIRNNKDFLLMGNYSHYIQLHGNSYENSSIIDFDREIINKTMEVNFFSTLNLIQILLPKMIESNFGRITLMGTASSNFGGGKNSFSYGLSKYSIQYLVKYLAKHYTSNNILTNAVSPGFIETKFHTKILNRSKKDLQERVKSIRLGKAGKSSDVSKVIFNLSFENNFISGENIKIDGGDFI